MIAEITALHSFQAAHKKATCASMHISKLKAAR
jgi:hypothetical protein